MGVLGRLAAACLQYQPAHRAGDMRCAAARAICDSSVPHGRLLYSLPGAAEDCASKGTDEMPIVAFDMTTANQNSRRFEFRGKNNIDYYDGDLEPLSPREVDMKIEKSVAGDYSIYKLVSSTGLAFRRSWSHIRNDKTDVTVFWFPRCGQITVSHPGGRYAIRPHQCAITRSCKAFYMELTPDSSGHLEAMHVVVPSHKLYAIIGDSMEVGRPFPPSIGDLSLTERILTLVFEGDDQIDPDIAEQLVHTLLHGLSRAVARVSDGTGQRCSITDKDRSEAATSSRLIGPFGSMIVLQRQSKLRDLHQR